LQRIANGFIVVDYVHSTFFGDETHVIKLQL